MKQKPSKPFFLLLISGILLTTITVLACGGGDWDEDEGSMFTPQIINQPKYTPFFRTLETPFYDGYDDAGASVFKVTNTKEWISFLGNPTSEEAINYWLYDASLKQVDSMIIDLKGKPSNLSLASKKYTLKPVAASAKAISFLYYLGFAKRNEDFVNPETNSWDDKPVKVSKESIVKQVAGGLNFYTKAKEPFLKERYAFQLERLYFFNKDYDKAISFFNDNVSGFSANSSMQWRALGYKAASLYKQKKYVESNYIYSIIYDGYEPLKKSAYLSFHPLQETEWGQCLALTKSTHEKEVLWQLSGLYKDDIIAMREILKLNPASDLVDLLLVRAVNSEENLVTEETDDEKKDQRHTTDKNLLDFLNDMSEQTASLNPVIWHLSAAYVNYINSDFTAGDKQMARAEKYKNTNALNKSEYHLISALGKIRRMKSINESAEKELVPDLEVLFSKETSDIPNFRSSNAREWIRKSIAGLYNKKGEVEKTELIYPGTNQYQFNDLGNLKKMIAYYEKTTLSDFEKLLFNYALLNKADYTELLAIRYAQEDRLDESLAAFKSGSEQPDELPGNPFTIHIKDCHDCDHEASQKVKYTKKAFIEKLIEMKKAAIAKPEEASQNYFLIANGFYNMTYFGNARMFYDNRVDNSIYTYDHKTVPEENSGMALKYYLMALQASTNIEFRAKCTFMAAKCEQNDFFMTVKKDYNGDFKSGIYFISLKKDFSGTTYYSEIIKECGYFRTYLGK